jgi:hypothetical protein
MGKVKAPKNQRPIGTSPSFQSHPSLAELYAQGKSLRDKCSHASHAAWKPAANRPDPLALLEESNKGRIPQLIPIRHGRMLQSPFTFYRGAALNMAADLAGRPATAFQSHYLGKSDKFDEAVADFAAAYADQSEKDTRS